MATALGSVKKIEQGARKLAGARELVADVKVLNVLGLDGNYAIPSSKGAGAYLVELEKSCTCPDFINRGGECKHLLAVYIFCYLGSSPASPACEINQKLRGGDTGHPFYGREIYFCNKHGKQL
jgi:hypothetical protein